MKTFEWYLYFIAQDPNWYRGRNIQGREGMIPATYVTKRKEVQLQKMPYVYFSIY